MAFKLKTSRQTEEILNRLEMSEHLPWPTLMRLAISLSIRQGPLVELEFYSDSLGKELNRQTITGDADILYKCLIELQEKRHISEEEYFPPYVKAHLDRGAQILEREKKYSRDLLIHLTELDKGL